jgi:pimeloyl-ACP methyl ester carboxylesterase
LPVSLRAAARERPEAESDLSSREQCLPTTAGASAEILARLQRDAAIHHTPCGNGSMIWRRWGAGAPVVLLHGGYGAWTHWLKNIDALSAHYRVVAPDLPGLGESAMPPVPYTPEGIAAILDRGLDGVLAAGERFHLVGFSFGAMLGGHVAAARGTRLLSFTLVGAASLGLHRGDMQPLEPVRRHMSDAEMTELQRVNLGILMFADKSRIDATAIRLQCETVAQARVKSRSYARSDILRRLLPRVAAPLAGIWGERDVTAFPDVAARGELLRQIQPGADFEVIAGAGHWVQYEAADAFNAVLLRFLAGTAAAARGA